MEHTFEELKNKTVAELREIAEKMEHEALHGYKTMHKDHLLVALCKALGIEAHAHHHVVGINKTDIKAKIRALKVERDAALQAHDHQKLQMIRRRIHNMKRKLRSAIV